MADFLLRTDIAEIADRRGERARGFAGRSVLLSGGCGFLGRYFVAVFEHLNSHLLDVPCTVVVLDNFITAGKEGEAFEGSQDASKELHDAVPVAWYLVIVGALGYTLWWRYRKLPV